MRAREGQSCEEGRCVLWSGASYGAKNTVPSLQQPFCLDSNCTYRWRLFCRRQAKLSTSVVPLHSPQLSI
ncbi:Hypothetical predicted protein [Podarcis lilfordi]|uniref:Uncharacterized protein n=1 Tax=Podarcis lilfordi TaxID=74358 RepID=A0AA35P730_9SAUR|nr:Hypothetical predicted protein [Podarcis lilfordi]